MRLRSAASLSPGWSVTPEHVERLRVAVAGSSFLPCAGSSSLTEQNPDGDVGMAISNKAMGGIHA
ncbi:hypothetical protein REMIM1_CH01108 [Rhizobium etli bv. mimosae str. Mim1]|nr:hypothetical protein REMIM1_CH01108 [Rhizobium etli bv. mimosae str. Mim1]